MRYPEESTTRENPLRIGTKRIKLSGVEYPFIAVSDHWRNTLLHEDRMVWIHHYRAIKGLRPSVFKVYYATVKVPYNRLPWTVDNKSDDIEYITLEEAIQVAIELAEKRKTLAQALSQAAANLGKMGGMVISEDKSLAARENGKRGGRISAGDKLKLD